MSTALRDLAEQYLAQRRQLGFALRIEGAELLRFVRYADQSGHLGPLTIDLAVRWARLPATGQPRYWARRLELVRRFAQYCAISVPGTEVPPAGLLGRTTHRPTPHIYSRAEISALMSAAASIVSTKGWRAQTYVTLFGLLASTGLRVGEALRLTRADLDLEAGVLTLTLTKFHKPRIVPLHETTRVALLRYDALRARFGVCSTGAFFLTEGAAPLGYAGVHATFSALRRALGWGPQSGRGGPRLHDLRHTFAVERLVRWSDEGTDLDRRVAALATYLGHVRVTDTYWYLTAVPALLATTASRFEAFAQGGAR